MGKILVIKSLAASQITYILAPLATNHEIIREINDLFYIYLWNNKGDKIKRSVIIRSATSLSKILDPPLLSVTTGYSSKAPLLGQSVMYTMKQ